MKQYIDSLAYCILVGNTKDIETDYKKIMHAKREIPASSCPSMIDNMLYASGSGDPQTSVEEYASFRVMTALLDEKAEKYDAGKQRRERIDSKFEKRRKKGISHGEWCRVDTDGVFMHNGQQYKIDPFAEQYQPVETEFGLLYDMDRILVTDDGFYDMNYEPVGAFRI